MSYNFVFMQNKNVKTVKVFATGDQIVKVFVTGYQRQTPRTRRFSQQLSTQIQDTNSCLKSYWSNLSHHSDYDQASSTSAWPTTTTKYAQKWKPLVTHSDCFQTPLLDRSQYKIA